MADSGFFDHEPLLVLPEKKHYVVIEGNRRLAALTVLLELPAANGVSLDIKTSKAQKKRLEHIPCFVLSSRDEARKYLGFRHINGLRTWPPEAKARYIAEEIDLLVHKRSEDPFFEAGRKLGGNSQGMRSQYTAVHLLRHASSEFGIETVYVLNERFGVWLRLMSAGAIKSFLGIADARTIDEIKKAIKKVKEPKLARVIGDLTPSGTSKAILADSRDVTDYGVILENPAAAKVLRETGSISAAKSLVEKANIDKQIEDIVGIVDQLASRAKDIEDLSAALAPAKRLLNSARALNAIVESTVNGEG